MQPGKTHKSLLQGDRSLNKPRFGLFNLFIYFANQALEYSSGEGGSTVVCHLERLQVQCG